MNFKLLITASLTACCFNMYAQNNGYNESAYVVTYQNDTIWGECNHVSAGKFFRSIKMKSEAGIVTKYKEAKIRAAGFIEKDKDIPSEYNQPAVWRQYEKIANPNDLTDSVMVEKIAYGPLMRLFVDPITTNMPKLVLRNVGFSFGSFGSGVNIDLGAMSRPLESFIIVKGNKQPIFINPNNFNKLFDALFGDCPAFLNIVNQNPSDKRFDQLPYLVSEYNHQCLYRY